MILPGSRVGFIDPAILWPMRSAFRDPCASSRHPSQCGGRCERAGRGCRRPAWDRRSVRASARPAVAKSGSWSEPGSDPRRSPTSRGARLTHRSWQTKTQNDPSKCAAATGYNQAMPPTVFETKGVPATRRQGMKQVEAGGRHTSVPYEARITADPFKRGVRTPGL
jgi:hypothetical protein